MNVPMWLVWAVAVLLAIAVPAVPLLASYMSEKDGEDGSSDVREEFSEYEWAEYLTEEEGVILATIIFHAQQRLYMDRSKAQIV